MPETQRVVFCGAVRKKIALMSPLAATSCSPRKTSWGGLSRIFTIISVTAVMILALFSRLIASTSETPVEFQSLYASLGKRDGFSIVEAGRVLQEEGDVSEPRISYETRLQLFICNPSLVEDGNDTYLVDTTRFTLALSRIPGLGQTDPDHIEVTIKTEPSDPEDLAYMCEEDGMLQWHAKIDYDADDSAASGMTPAVMAAQANDYITYSSSEFRALLSVSINDEYASSAETVDLSPEDLVVRNVGWIVTFPSEMISVLEAETTRSSDDTMIGLAAYIDLWDLWMWLVMGLLLGCCIGPFCLCLFRKQDNKNTITRDCPENNQTSGEIRGSEWSTKEPDIEKDSLHDEEMARDHNGVGRGIGFKSHSLSNQGGQRGVGHSEYVQKTGKRPVQPSTLPRPDGHSLHHIGLNHEDINMERPHGNQSQYKSNTRGRSRWSGFEDNY